MICFDTYCTLALKPTHLNPTRIGPPSSTTVSLHSESSHAQLHPLAISFSRPPYLMTLNSLIPPCLRDPPSTADTLLLMWLYDAKAGMSLMLTWRPVQSHGTPEDDFGTAVPRSPPPLSAPSTIGTPFADLAFPAP